jgi:hypothetical protein
MAAKSKRRARPRRLPAKKPGTSKRRRGKLRSEIIAVANLEPPRPFELYVRAKVTVGDPGHRAHLEPGRQGINPKILVLDVVIEKLPGTWPEVVTQIDAIYEDGDYEDQYTQVTVTKPVNETVDIQVAH